MVKNYSERISEKQEELEIADSKNALKGLLQYAIGGIAFGVGIYNIVQGCIKTGKAVGKTEGRRQGITVSRMARDECISDLADETFKK